MSENNSHLPCFGQTEFSPMTEISINLSGTKISHIHTRKRRLSLSAEESESLDKYVFPSETTVDCVHSTKTITYTSRRCLQDITNTQCEVESSHKRFISSTVVSSRYPSIIDSPSRHDGEISLYGGATPETRSPESSPELPKKCGGARLKSRRDDCQYSSFGLPGSQDSGLGSSFQDRLSQESKSVHFIEPCSVNDNTALIPRSRSLFRGLSDLENAKDEFMEYLEVETLDDTIQLPVDFNKLVSGDILTDITKSTTPKFESNLSSVQTVAMKYCRTPASSRVRNRLFPSSPQSTPLNHNKENDALEQVLSNYLCDTKTEPPHCLKRSKSLFDSTDKTQTKRYKTAHGNIEPSYMLESLTQPGCSTPKPVLRRSISTCSPNTIMTAVQRSSVEPDLIGDFSKPFVLPLVSGRHQDLKSITASTLAALIRGEYDNTVDSYKVIDCRYPYEFEGGHVRGALNYYTKEQIETELFNIKKDTPITQKPQDAQSKKRDIVIFHCEFSAQRGPKLFRFLRAIDRNHNNDVYPALHYPEIYLLEGGYKRFFESYSELCEPAAYKRMDDPAHEEECRQFRAQKRNANVPAGARKLLSKRSALEF